MYVEEITRNSLLKKISQEEIFKYIGITPVLNGKIKNPLRHDKKVTVSFKWLGDTLHMLDHSGWYKGDCIGLYAKLNNLTYRQAIESLYYLPVANQSTRITDKPIKKKNLAYNIILENLLYNDLEWWGSYKITPTTLSYYKVFRVRRCSIGNYTYYYNSKDPAYYYQIMDKWKIYFPLREEYRFLSNIEYTDKQIQGYEQLPSTGEILVITKSLKDVMCYYEFGIPAISVNSESTILPDYVIQDLMQRFKLIYINMDFDLTGVRLTNKFKRKYQFKYFFFRDKTIKDFADFCKANNISNIYKLINKLNETNCYFVP